VLVSSYITPKARKGAANGIEGCGRDWQRPDLQRKYRDYFSTYRQRRFATRPGPDPSHGGN